jgi:hypothetical protein
MYNVSYQITIKLGLPFEYISSPDSVSPFDGCQLKFTSAAIASRFANSALTQAADTDVSNNASQHFPISL